MQSFDKCPARKGTQVVVFQRRDAAELVPLVVAGIALEKKPDFGPVTRAVVDVGELRLEVTLRMREAHQPEAADVRGAESARCRLVDPRLGSRWGGFVRVGEFA